MAKQILAFCAVIMAFAAMPTLASATNSPELTENGTQVKVGEKILATSVEKMIMTNPSSGATFIECDTVLMTGLVTKNDGSNVELTIEMEETHNTGSGGCSGALGTIVFTPSTTSNPSTNGLPWCIRSTSTMITDEFQMRGNACNGLARPIRRILHTGFGECVYQRTAAVLGTFVTGIGKTTLSISTANAGSEFAKLSGNFQCPEKARFGMTFTLESDAFPFARLDII